MAGLFSGLEGGWEGNPAALKIIIMTEMDTIYISNFDTCENNFL